MNTLRMLNLAATIAMVLADPVQAKSFWTQIEEVSSSSAQPAEFVERDMGRVFSDLADTAPRSGSYFETLAEQVP